MSIPMNAGAESARESARQANGEFGTQPIPEADHVDLVATTEDEAQADAHMEFMERTMGNPPEPETGYCAKCGDLWIEDPNGSPGVKVHMDDETGRPDHDKDEDHTPIPENNVCERHGGEWGDDPTCARCTNEDGTVRNPSDPGPMGPGAELSESERCWDCHEDGQETPATTSDDNGPLCEGCADRRAEDEEDASDDEEYGVSDAYPNGRCQGCGSGVDEAGLCYQHDCSNFDEDSVYAADGHTTSGETVEIVKVSELNLNDVLIEGTVTSIDNDHKSTSIELDNDPDTIASYDNDSSVSRYVNVEDPNGMPLLGDASPEASPEMQAAVFNLVTNHRIGDVDLTDHNLRVVSASNPDKEASATPEAAYAINRAATRNALERFEAAVRLGAVSETDGYDLGIAAATTYTTLRDSRIYDELDESGKYHVDRLLAANHAYATTHSLDERAVLAGRVAEALQNALAIGDRHFPAEPSA